MNRTLTTENQKLSAFIEANRVPTFRGLRAPRVTDGWALDFCRRLENSVGGRWRIHDGMDGALALYYEDGRGKWNLFFCGRSGAFGSQLVRWIEINHWSRNKARLAELERAEAEKERSKTSEINDASYEIARSVYRANTSMSIDMGRGA